MNEEDILDFVKDTDGFIIISPNYKNNEIKEKVLEYANSKIGTPYDKYYCHEFTESCLKVADINIKHGKMVYADDLIKNCTIVYESDDPTFNFFLEEKELIEQVCYKYINSLFFVPFFLNSWSHIIED